jgi:hypothetical protein
MATLENTLKMVPDPELRVWIYDYFVREYGPHILDQDVESWYNVEGGRVTSSPFTPITRGNTTTVTAVPEYSVYGGYKGSSRHILCLYGLISILHKSQNNT